MRCERPVDGGAQRFVCATHVRCAATGRDSRRDAYAPHRSPAIGLSTEWQYDKIQNRLGRSVRNAEPWRRNRSAVACAGTSCGHPGQRQQNFALEGLINEAAAAAKADPIQFRVEHTTDQRLIDMSERDGQGGRMGVAAFAASRRTKDGEWRGEPGVACASWCAPMRTGSGIAEVSGDSGDRRKVQVTKFTIGVDCGKIINPRQLDRCMKSGVAMGLSEALKEEVTFDKEKVTSTNWSRYKILTMEEMPEIQGGADFARRQGVWKRLRSCERALFRPRWQRRSSMRPECSLAGFH